MQNGFEVGLPLSRVWKDDSGVMWFEGVASSTSLDKQQERMTENAIRKMATFSGIDLLPDHRAGPLEELGTVTETFADNRTFRVAGTLDADSPEARRLFEKAMQGKPYQLSVGGRVTRAFWAHDDELGKRIRHIDDVVLDHVALCRPGQAANSDTYLQVMAKSVAGADVKEAWPSRESQEEGPEPQGLALRMIRALLEVLWPFAKSKDSDEGEEAADAAGLVEVSTEEQSQESAQASELHKLREHNRRLEKAVQDLAERLERLERRRGAARSIPGQEQESKRRENLWKGVL